jgi:hypothetical protein
MMNREEVQRITITHGDLSLLTYALGCMKEEIFHELSRRIESEFIKGVKAK